MRNFRFLILFLLVCLVCLSTPRAKAAEDTIHTHCVCGGSAVSVGDHTQCRNITWIPLSSVVDLKKVNWKDVPSGHYYLDGDVTVKAVTDGNAIGQVTKNADGTYTVNASRQVSICLNGYTITTEKDRVFKGVYTGSTLNICDCSGGQVDGVWQWDGSITGGTSSSGGITYTYANSTVNIFGGNLTAKEGQTVTSGGGLFYVAQDRAPVGDTVGKADPMYASTLSIYNGNLYGGSSAKNGGNIYVVHYSNLNVYGGSIHDGTAAQTDAKGKGGNIYSGGNATVNNKGGDIYGGYPEVAKVITDGVASVEYTLADAVKNYKGGSIIRLYRDLETDLAINQNMELDLNGHNLAGISGNFTCFDSATEFGTDAGILSCTGNVTAKAGYMPLSAENGTSFYRCAPEITHLSIDPANTAIGYKANIIGKAILSQVEDFGLEMWLDGYDHRHFSKPEIDGQLTLRLKNILTETYTDEANAANANTPVYAFAYVVLKDGTKLCGDTVAYSFKDMLHAADDCYASFNATQKAALQTMAGKYSRIMMTWDVENFHHAQGGMWEAVNASAFLNKLTKNGSYHDVTPGSYVLTSDVDISTRTMRITSGTTVNICLNGHTITGSKRMMRIYGTLNLCDCHAHGESEGGMTSSFTSESGHGGVFYTYYGSVFNLYGGNLKATGTLATSGVGAVSHEDQDGHPDVAPGVMNMYGGTLSGGTTTGNGGLLALYHGGSFHMFGGELYNGNAGGHGGAINVSGSSQVGLYGGIIRDCQSYVTDSNGQTSHSPDGVYMNKGQLTLAGNVQIDHLYLSYTAQLDGDGLTTDAKVRLVSDVHGFLSNNTALKNVFTLNEGQRLVEFDGKLLILEADVDEKPLQNTFSVGNSQICINPAVAEGVPLSGYGNSADRLSTGFESEAYWLYANATAITDENGNTVLLITHDLQRPQNAVTDPIRQAISKATGLPVENIMLSASHSHSTPDLYSGNDLIDDYKILLQNKFIQAAVEAMASRVPATIQAGTVAEVRSENGKYMNFSRHYSWYGKNGILQYYGDNFGTAPSTAAEKKTLQHVAEGDHSMQIIRFNREGEKDVILCNWAAHPTMTGGSDAAKYNKMSADYVGAFRTKLQAETDCYFSFIQGAAGNMNTTSRISGEQEYAKAQYQAYGERLADVVIQKLGQLETVQPGKVQALQSVYDANVWKHSDEELARATEFNALPLETRKATYKDWGFTSIFHASSIVAKSRLNDQEKLELNTFSIGNSIAFFTAPGELWAETGLNVKGDSPFRYTITTGYTNGDWKYFPDGQAADGTYENYEYFYSRFVLPDTTKEMMAFWKEALERLYNN